MSGPTLTAPFKNTEQLSKGGRTFTYVPTPEVIERLNTCLGYGGWSFEVSEAFHQPQDDPQYVVAKGRLTACGGVYEQYGGQTPNRNKQGVILDLADDYKGAASDALKKCAAMIGVGLYLSLKRSPTPNEVSPGGVPFDRVTTHATGGISDGAGERVGTPPAPSTSSLPREPGAEDEGVRGSASSSSKPDSLERIQSQRLNAALADPAVKSRFLAARAKKGLRNDDPAFLQKASDILDLLEREAS